MISMGDALRSAFGNIGNVEHVPAEAGDYIDDGGYLCCGVCKKRKEFRRQHPFAADRLMVVPALCDCGKAEVERERQQQQLRKERKQVDELFQYSLIDERFRESTFENVKVTQENAKAVRIARNYVAHFDEMYSIAKGLLLYGPTGTGKTYLADCIANALIRKGVPVLVTSIVALTRGLGKQLPETLQKMKSARLLVLDDFGAERFTDFKSEQIFDVIDSRYGSKKPMIITTNYSLTEMKEPDGIRQKRVNERILEVCHPVKMDGASWRKKIVKENYSAIAALLEQEEE